MMKNFISISKDNFFSKKVFLVLTVTMLIAGGFFIIKPTLGFNSGDVLINEFDLNGGQWVELMNNTNSDINLASSTWQFVALESGAGQNTTTLSGIIPAHGLITFVPTTTLSVATDTLLSLINGTSTAIYSVSYGNPATFGVPNNVAIPGVSQSAILTGFGTTWSATSTISKGWFNETAPSVDTIVAGLAGITTNWSTSTDSSAITGLYFEKTGMGRVTFGATLNLTNASTTAFLQSLGSKMDAAAGRMKFDARTATDLKNAGATISIYGLTNNGYNYSSLNVNKMTVRDDDGVALATSSPSYPALSNATTSAANNGTFTFDASHFTQFEFDPVLAEVTPVTTPTASTSPAYVFSSNATGTAIFGGACVATPTASTSNGNNNVILGPLPAGVYSNCTVKVVDGGGASSTLAISSFTIVGIPTAPTNVSATATSSSAIIAGWNTVSGADYYTIYKSTDGTSFSTVATTSSLTYQNGSLTANSLYYYIIKAVNIAGTSPSSTATSTYTFAATPASLTATASTTNSISLAWGENGNPGGTVYQISGAGIVTTTTTATSTTVSGLTPNTHYTISVQAQNGAGVFGSAATVSEWTVAVVPVSLSSVSTAATSLTYSWGDNGNPVGTVYRLAAGSNVATTTATSTTVSGLTPNTSYAVTAQAYNSDGSLTAPVGPTMKYTLAANPTSLAVTASTTSSITLTWSENSNPTSTVYQISGTGITTATTTATTTVVSGLTSNTAYTINVQSQNNDASWNAVATISIYTKSAAPTSPQVMASSTASLSLSWGDNSNPGGTIYQFSGAGITTATTTATSTVISGLIPNTFYTIAIYALNNEGSLVGGATTTSYTAAAAPSSLLATALSLSAISLSWSANSNPGTTVYQVYNVTTAAVFGTTTATTTSVTGLAMSTNYQFAVRAQNDSTNTWSAYSATSTAVSTYGTPTVTTQDASSISTSTVTLNGTIGNNNGASSTYRGFYYGTTSTSLASSSLAGPSTYNTGVFSSDITGLTPGTVYYFSAMASNTQGIATGTTRSFVTTVSLSASNPTSTITSANTATSTIEIPLSVTNPTVDLTSIIATTTTSTAATLPGAITATATTSLGAITVNLPAGINITGDATWNGIINLPTVKDNSTVTATPDSGYTATVAAVIEVGYNNVALTFDKAVRLLIPGAAGKNAGYSRSGSFTKITDACASDSQATGDALAAGGNCKIDSGSDLVIWTKHFTSFVTYTQTVQSGGGSSGPILINNSAKTEEVVTSTPKISSEEPAVSPTVTAAPISEQPLIAKQIIVTKLLTKDLKLGATDSQVKELQILLKAQGLFKAEPITVFGKQTLAAVKAFQQKNKLRVTGIVDQATRNVLNDLLNKVAKPVAKKAIFTSSLQMYSVSNEVRKLQEKLKAEGFFIGQTTANFGKQTLAALKAYQKKNNLKVTGIVDKATREMLNK